MIDSQQSVTSPNRPTIRDRYDASAHLYDRMEAPAEWLGLNRLRREVFSRATGRVLEVAVGTGANLAHFPPDVHVCGVDFSREMAVRARARSVRLRRRLTVALMDAERLGFPDAQFDSVVSSLSACTYVEPVLAFREMARVCRPGGRVLLIEHGRSRYEWIARWQDRRADAHAESFGCRWNRDPSTLVAQAGLDVRWSRRTFFGMLHLIEATPRSHR